MAQIVPQRIVNVSEVKETLSEPTLIHFTAAQWERTIAGAKEGRVERGQGAVEAAPLPGMSGDMLVGVVPKDAKTKTAWVAARIPKDDPIIVVAVPDFQDVGPFDLEPIELDTGAEGSCRLGLVPGELRLGCVSINCRGRCVLVMQGIGRGSLLGCECL